MTEHPAAHPPRSASNEAPLESWKEIAAYLKRDVSTVKRWETIENLPVHRHLHQARSSVYAYASELDAWWARRRPAEEPARGWFERRPLRVMALAVVALFSLLSAGDGLAPGSVTAAQGPAVVTKRLWSGDAVDALGAPSPDGRYLSFVHWPSGNLAVRDLARDETRYVTGEGTWQSPSQYAYYSIWSPDGSRLAYEWLDTAELRIVDVNGGKPRVLYRNAEKGRARPDSWSDDGKSILVLLRNWDNTNEIALISSDDGSVRVLKSLDWRSPVKMSLSPDGKYVAYDVQPDENSAQRDIFLLPTDGGREVPLVHHPGVDYGPLWSPDGKTIVFASDRTGSLSAWAQNVENGKAEGSPRLIKQQMDRYKPLGMTRDGVLFYAHVVFENSGDVFVAALESATRTALAEPEKPIARFEGWNTSPAWSPDGKRLAFVSQRGPLPSGMGTAALVIRDLQTGGERELFPKLERLLQPRHSAPRWSPDGKSLLITGSDHTGRRDFFLVDAQSGAVRPLGLPRSEAVFEFPSWSPDGKRIYFDRRGKGIQVFDLASKTERELLAGAGVYNPSVSPRGNLLAFRTPKSVEVMPVGGGKPRALVIAGEGEMISEYSRLAWTPDGKHVLFVKRQPESTDGWQVWQVPIDGGAARAVGIQMRQIRDLDMHPRELRLAFAAGAGGDVAEVWAMENFLPALTAAK